MGYHCEKCGSPPSDEELQDGICRSCRPVVWASGLKAFVLKNLKTGKVWDRKLPGWVEASSPAAPTFYFVGDAVDRLGNPPFKECIWEEQFLPGRDATVYCPTSSEEEAN